MLGMPPLGTMLLLRGVALLTAASAMATAQVVDVGTVRIQLCTPEIVRVLAAGSSAVEAVGNKSSLVVVNEWPEEVAHTVAKDADGATEIKTEALKVVVATDGNVSFFSIDSLTGHIPFSFDF